MFERLIRAFRSSVEAVSVLKVESINISILKYPRKGGLCIFISIITLHISSTGCCVTRECLVASLVKTKQLQIQERTIHVSQLFCSFYIRMVIRKALILS